MSESQTQDQVQEENQEQIQTEAHGQVLDQPSEPEESESQTQDQSPEENIKAQERKISMIILHCSDSDVPAHDNIETIREWHTKRGFIGPDGVAGNEDDIGYHFFINKKGEIFKGRPVSAKGAHCKGHNDESIGICLSGRNQFTKEQYKAANKLTLALFSDFKLSWKNVRLHNQLDKTKTCPNYKMEDIVSGC